MLLRLQTISLAIVLAIIDKTHGFTLRHDYVRPHDLTAEESRASEVRHELKRDVEEHEEFQVAPIAIALPLTVSTETVAETTLNSMVGLSSSIAANDTREQIETTTNPEQVETTIVINIEDDKNTTSENDEIRNLLNEIRNEDTTTSTQEETTTEAVVALVVADNDVEASANEEINNTTASKITVAEPVNVTVTAESSVNSSRETPTRKKYTKIERKHVTASDEVIPLRIERVGDSINAHTTESRVSLEKAFDLAPDILSLQMLKNHLLETPNTLPTEANPTEMVSKRAGYLNHTKPVDAVVSTTANTSDAGNEIEMGGVAYEMEAHDENDDTRNKTSHSQLVEDALKEELLAEARLEDEVRFTTSRQHQRANVGLNEVTPTPPGVQHDQHGTDKLTVRPIHNDKKTILYTVSPNYKPLKKIEVQSMKPFVRDPDDNSWRNESLSSLGIVFKGKNSSKAFTEVLKNKTETEMSNTTEPEKVSMKVELRDRLEKIAEKRKRKKKIDKFGNTEYGDYEENSSGDMQTSKEKPEIPLTTLPTPPDLINPGISLGTILNSPPTQSPKIFKAKYPLGDYFDGKDDDVDYATYTNIDILKSTPRPRVQWPVTQKILDNTQPIKTYLPDRQPTVQYFPPRPKTVIGDANDYRDDYKPKFVPFGHTSQPQDEPNETDTEKNMAAKRFRTQNDNKNPTIQHVEYRPVGETDNGFVIRHYKDLLESVAKDINYEPYQSSPMSDEGKPVKSEEYDYGQRKEGLNKFVDYFNQNHERFKADFPVIFNTSVIHGAESGKVLASSSAMFKRLYNGARAQEQAREEFAFNNKPFDPNCDNITVELSPAYELHYYVPEQEEIGSDHTMQYGYTVP